ncbi:MAG: aminotransferase class V-fold PLP-dependent enzyme, partial [Bacteroidetes bacterium]
VDEAVAAIREHRPDVVFAPHVETSAGMLLPDGYLAAVADAVHAHGGLFVLDCVASGSMWVDMRATGVDVIVSAPQKGWSSTPCAGLVMLSERARSAIDGTTSSSFSLDLKSLAEMSPAEAPPSAILAPHVDDPALRDAVRALRDSGEVVVSRLPGQHPDTEASFRFYRQLTRDQGAWRVVPLQAAAAPVPSPATASLTT